MSWSLRIRNGDLALDGQKLSTTTGFTKLVQDLRCALLEPRSHDPYHPEFGSIIDGGYDEFGEYQASMLGETDWDFTALRVETEIRRICSLHQTAQVKRDKEDRTRYGRSTLAPDELISSITDVKILQVQDVMIVNVKVRTATGQVGDINVPIAEGVNVGI